MKKGVQRNLSYDIKDFLKKFFGSRLFVLAVLMIVLFSVIIGRVFSLQVINGKYYQDNFTMSIKKSVSIEATRGNIYDCNGKLLAYNKLAYSIEISDSGSYSSTKEKNRTLNAELADIIRVLSDNNEKINNDFNIVLDDENNYVFNVSGTKLNRFRADVFGKAKIEDLGYNKTIQCNEATATADEVMEYLMSSSVFAVDESYDTFYRYNIVVLRYAMKQNTFSKYKTTTIANDVSDKVVAYMNEHSDELSGVSIKEDTIRKYNDAEYFAPVIGYTGIVSSEDFDSYYEKDNTYTPNDSVGKTGLEKTYESYLRGTNGEKEFYVNHTGRIIEEISSKESKPGNNLYISIDKDIQKASYLLLEQEIAGIVYSKIKSGDIPINDVYYALINNNVIDINHFKDEKASKNEKSLYKSFSGAQKNVLSKINTQLRDSPMSINDMSEEMLDYFTSVINLLKNDDILNTSLIDESDDVFVDWKNGKISPQEYLKYCISKQWIDISLLSVEQKYADTSEIFTALCDYINNELMTDKEFCKLIYKYMIERGSVTGQKLCLILFDQGVLDYDDNTVKNLSNGTTSPYTFLMDKINNIDITPAQLALDPCTGSTVITDVKTGEIKALVSYPGYDNNRVANGADSKYFQSLMEDKSNPLYNYATMELTAPGSTFKMVTSTAALAENLITTTTDIKCTGIFKEIKNKPPKCWVYPSNHGSINVSEAIRDSCNIFYYTIGNELAKKDSGKYNEQDGIDYIQKYAKIYALDKLTNIDIEEKQSKMATIQPITAAIGQSNNAYTTIALARYVTAVASGNLYDYMLMKKIEDVDGKVIDSYKAKSTSVKGTLSTSEWDAIHSGMRMVVQTLDSFKGFTIDMAGKTGTAQESEKRPDHALFVGYAPYKNPEISIAVRIAWGYSSHNAASAARNIISYYYKERSLKDILADKASGVNVSSSNNRTD